jgi:hypothetical protein
LPSDFFWMKVHARYGTERKTAWKRIYVSGDSKG